MSKGSGSTARGAGAPARCTWGTGCELPRMVGKQTGRREGYSRRKHLRSVPVLAGPCFDAQTGCEIAGRPVHGRSPGVRARECESTWKRGTRMRIRVRARNERHGQFMTPKTPARHLFGVRARLGRGRGYALSTPARRPIGKPLPTQRGTLCHRRRGCRWRPASTRRRLRGRPKAHWTCPA